MNRHTFLCIYMWTSAIWNISDLPDPVGKLFDKNRLTADKTIKSLKLALFKRWSIEPALNIEHWTNRVNAKAPCKRSQHCWPTRRNLVGPNRSAQHVASVCTPCWVLLRVSNFIQQLPTIRNNTQQHTTWCANARNMLGPTMLCLVGQQCCERLHGA